MLTYSTNNAPQRKDRPWLLVILILIWILGTSFFHSPWEPYEPFVFAVVKGIIRNHLWLVPYVSSVPYLEVQPFYFWIYSAIIKLLDINNAVYIANAVRLINMSIILGVISLAGIIGSNLSAYKNGRTVLLILISSIGFINNAYQLSPNILILLGFCLYIYALQLHHRLPGISGGILFIGLFFMSIGFTAEFVIIGLLLLVILPCIDRYWRTMKYISTVGIGVILFATVFYLYCYQLSAVNNDFFLQWQSRYMSLFISDPQFSFLTRVADIGKLLLWFLLPSWFLVAWAIYRRRSAIFKDKTIQLSIVLSIMLILFSIFIVRDPQNSIFPIVITAAFIASIEVDSIRISIVSLFNWFSIFTFGAIGLILWLIYAIFNLGHPQQVITYLSHYTQGFTYAFNFWNLLLAILITFIWFFMITRRHIRGREMVTNWASGTTCVIILFLSLWLPWFDSILTFKPIVENSLKYINKTNCIGTNTNLGSQIALWYYYADINLMPGFYNNLDSSICNQAIIATEDISHIDQKQWKIVWGGRRPIDKKIYYVIKHK